MTFQKKFSNSKALKNFNSIYPYNKKKDKWHLHQPLVSIGISPITFLPIQILNYNILLQILNQNDSST